MCRSLPEHTLNRPTPLLDLRTRASTGLLERDRMGSGISAADPRRRSVTVWLSHQADEVGDPQLTTALQLHFGSWFRSPGRSPGHRPRWPSPPKASNA